MANDGLLSYGELERRVEERTRELSILLEISHNLSSNLQLKPLLSIVLQQLKTIVDYAGAGIFTLQDNFLTLLHYVGPVPLDEVLDMVLPLDKAAANRAVIERRAPVIVDDIHQPGDVLGDSLRGLGVELMDDDFEYARSWMGVPLLVKDRLIGMLTLDYTVPYYYTTHHARLALAVAQQAAVAIENARLYHHAQELAALEERQRLARDLHDSISQSLFSIVLNARSARTMLDRNPAGLAEPLDQLIALSAMAMAEMRSLIFELRPESLAKEGLVIALNRQIEALRAKRMIVLQSDLCSEPPLPLPLKEAAYRIAQEAINNAVRHSGASRISIRLECDDEWVRLLVRDNGSGFNPGADFPGHLGLQSMRERAVRVGALYAIESKPGEGTTVSLRIALPK